MFNEYSLINKSDGLVTLSTKIITKVNPNKILAFLNC